MDHQTGTIHLEGDNNRIILGEHVSLNNARIQLLGNSSFICGANTRLAAIEVLAAKHGHIRIGARSGFTWSTSISLHEAGAVTIGEACLIASGVLLTVSDMHSIIDIESGMRINQAEDVIVGDRVWVGGEAKLLKGAQIGSGSIIGYGSIVTKQIPENCLAAGVPAKVIRTGVTWRPELI